MTCAQILAFVLDASQTGGSLSGQEQRDMLFARLFGITALVRSGLLVRTAPLPSSGSAAPHASSARAFGDVRAVVGLDQEVASLRDELLQHLIRGSAARLLESGNDGGGEGAGEGVLTLILVLGLLGFGALALGSDVLGLAERRGISDHARYIFVCEETYLALAGLSNEVRG